MQPHYEPPTDFGLPVSSDLRQRTASTVVPQANFSESQELHWEEYSPFHKFQRFYRDLKMEEHQHPHQQQPDEEGDETRGGAFLYAPPSGQRVRRPCCRISRDGFLWTLLNSILYWMILEFFRVLVFLGDLNISTFFFSVLPAVVSWKYHVPSEFPFLFTLCVFLFTIFSYLVKSLDRFIQTIRYLDGRTSYEIPELDYHAFLFDLLRKRYRSNFCYGLIEIHSFRIALIIHCIKIVSTLMLLSPSLILAFYSSGSSFCSYVCPLNNGTIN